MFDINFFPIHLIASQEQSELDGLLVTAPPRRTERVRSEDILMILLSMVGSASLSPEYTREVLDMLATTYYHARGTTTSALQASANELNDCLLQCNSRRNSIEGQVLALLNIAVLRKDHLFFAHAGSTHSYLIKSSEYKHFSEPQSTTHSVGLGRSTQLTFSQSKIESGSIFIMCPAPPHTWTDEYLSNTAQLSLENLRRRLLQQAQDDLQSAVIQFQTGNGTIRRLRRRPVSNQTPAISSNIEKTNIQNQSPPNEPAEETVIVTSEIENEKSAIRHGRVTRIGVDSETSTEEQTKKKHETLADTETELRTGTTNSFGKIKKKKLVTHTWTIFDGEIIRNRLAHVWTACRENCRRFQTAISKVVSGILPGLGDQPNIPAGVMYFIAIAVPVIVVAAATTVYIRNGRYEQHLAYLQQAQLYAYNAQSQPDTTLKRMAWEKTIEWINTAEQYARSDEAVSLRDTANLALDELDGISSFKVHPALSTSFDSNVDIHRMVANNTEVFLLDSNAGKVQRLFLAGNAYEIDPSFNCEPGLAGSIYITKLVDIVSLPLNNVHKSSIMAIDEKGNLLFCRSSDSPLSSYLVPPDQSWSKISGLAFQSDKLFVLDIAANAVWVYHGKDLTFDDEPYFFFGYNTPDMKSVVDFAVNEDALYLLHRDGKIHVCLFNAYDYSSTSCSEITSFKDMRQGQNSQTINFVGSRFTNIQATYPLEPSLYTLESEQGFIYHMSLQLNLHNQYRPDPDSDYSAPTDTPSAFVITPGRILLLAYTNHIYFSALP